VKGTPADDTRLRKSLAAFADFGFESKKQSAARSSDSYLFLPIEGGSLGTILLQHGSP
jgi:hypothetical protein